MRIPDEKIDEVRNAADIVDVIGATVRLKKRGRSYVGLCPFHPEKTPSFTVSADKQMFHCFGCGKGGNVFTFVMERDKMSFVEAVRFLADRAGVRLPAEGRGPEDSDGEQDQLFEICRIAGLHFQDKDIIGNYFGNKLVTPFTIVDLVFGNRVGDLRKNIHNQGITKALRQGW